MVNNMGDVNFSTLMKKQLSNNQGLTLDATRIYKAVNPDYDVFSLEGRGNDFYRCVISLEHEERKEKSESSGIWAKIKAFFAKILQWIKNAWNKVKNWFLGLFKKGGKEKAEKVDEALKNTPDLRIEVKDKSETSNTETPPKKEDEPTGGSDSKPDETSGNKERNTRIHSLTEIGVKHFSAFDIWSNDEINLQEWFEEEMKFLENSINALSKLLDATDPQEGDYSKFESNFYKCVEEAYAEEQPSSTGAVDTRNGSTNSLYLPSGWGISYTNGTYDVQIYNPTRRRNKRKYEGKVIIDSGTSVKAGWDAVAKTSFDKLEKSLTTFNKRVSATKSYNDNLKKEEKMAVNNFIRGYATLAQGTLDTQTKLMQAITAITNDLYNLIVLDI